MRGIRAAIVLAATVALTVSLSGGAGAARSPIRGAGTTAAGIPGFTITPTSSASVLASAITADPALVTSATLVHPPSGTPNGVATSLGGMPTNGSNFALLTTGDVNLADDPNDSDSSGENDGGGNVRGDTDFDVSILRINLNVPAYANCVGFDFKYWSEEYPEFVNTEFNDAFIAEMDTSDWSTNNADISAPHNFAFDPTGNVISINAAGNTSMSAANAAGTTYDGATPLLQAFKAVTPGAHSLYLSIFDQGDNYWDSAVGIDNLHAYYVADPATHCKSGAQPPPKCLGKNATIVGTSAADTLLGTTNDDVIVGLGGDDKIYGVGGNDTICGGAGNDTIDAGDGADTVSGDLGNDTVDGNTGNDIILGGAGADTLKGSDGNDFFIGGPDNDTIDGGIGTDYADFRTAPGPVTATLATTPGTATGEGSDTLTAIESLWGSPFADNLTGSNGPNLILGQGGNDKLFGLAGADTLLGGAGNDDIDGGADTDTCNQNAGTGTITNCP